MTTLTITHGLPGSGKSTWANSQDAKVVELDEIRFKLYGRYHGFSKEQKSEIYRIRNQSIRSALMNGVNVISSDTNLFKWQTEEVERIGRECGAKIAHKYFDVPLDVCLQRNANRKRIVPESAIRGMAAKMPDLATEPFNATDELKKLPLKMSKFILVDIDGTLAANNNLTKKFFASDKPDFDGFFKSIESTDPYWPLVRKLRDAEAPLVALTGRSDKYYAELMEFIESTSLTFQTVIAKPAASRRNTNLWKMELLEEMIARGGQIIRAYDDKPELETYLRARGWGEFIRVSQEN